MAGETPGQPRALPRDAAAHARAADVLAQAFADDPVARHVDPDPVRRAPAVRVIFDALVAAPATMVTIRVIGDPIVGVAIWQPPASASGEEAELWAALALPDPRQLERFREAIGALDEIHCATAGGPHWYLIFLGTHPAARGSGIGSALLAALHADADASGLPCALEAFGTANRVFYERRGYAVVATSPVPFSAEPVYSMRRMPR